MDLSTTHLFILALGSIVAGILLLIRGGNWTIDSAVYIANKYGISPLIVGFTIIAFGTSLPELVVSVFANMQGSGGIAIGNVIGSNIANIALVVGVTAAMATLHVHKNSLKSIRRDLFMMLGCTLLLAGLLFYGDITRTAGVLMCALLAGYILLQYKMAQKGEIENPLDIEEAEQEFKNKAQAFFFLLIGLIIIAIGAEFLVRGAKVSATIIGVPEAVIALSIIAFGTSLPELSTSIIAARKGHSDIALGNIIGSNVFNILLIIGITSLVKPILQSSYVPQLATFDIWIAFGIAAIFAGSLILFKKISRPLGGLFILGYILYNGYIFTMY